MVKNNEKSNEMLDQQFEIFIRTQFAHEYEKRTSALPHNSIQEIWPEEWTAFKFLESTFNELIDENTRLHRENVQHKEKSKILTERNRTGRSLISTHMRLNQGDPELTLRAVDRALLGSGEL